MLLLMNLHFDVKKNYKTGNEKTENPLIISFTGTLWGSVFHSLVLLLFLLKTSEVLFCF